VFDAIFTASSGQSFSFGYKAGVLYSIDPIGDLPVELETSQGYQQVGATVESRSISGVTRTITGRILRNTAYLKRQLRDIFTPGATGRLTVAGKYYCDAEVQRCPAISAANLWPTFSFQLYCPNPYWRSVSETSVSLFYTQPAFRLPVCYSTHQFGLRIQSDFLKLSNPGPDTQDFVLTLTAQGVVRNPGVRDLATGEYLRFLTEMQDGDVIRLWREDGRLRIEQIIIPQDFIGAVIGPGGKVIQEIQKSTGTTITITEKDNKGFVDIFGENKDALEAALARIKGIVAMPEVGEVYKGKIRSIVAFGAFVEILPGKDGLLHISEIANRRFETMEQTGLKEGDMIEVKLIGLDPKNGKLKLSRKALLNGKKE